MSAIVSLSKKSHVFAVLLGGAVFFLILGLTAAWNTHQELVKLETNGQQKLGLYSKVLENELRRHQYLPLALAKNKDIIEFLLKPSNDGQKDQLNRYLEKVSHQTDASAIYLMNSRGLTVASSNWASATSYVGHNYSFRPYFQDSLNGRPGNYFAIGATTKTPGLFLSFPVFMEKEVLGVVAVKISMEPLEQGWAQQGPEKVFMADADGVIFSSSEPDWKFRTLSPLPPEVRHRLKAARKYLNVDLFPLGVEALGWAKSVGEMFRVNDPLKEQGIKALHLAQQAPLPGTPWTLHIYSDLSPVARSIANSLAISCPSAMALVLLLFYLIDHRHYLQERKRYQLMAKKKLEVSAAERRAIIGHTRAALVIVTPGGELESFNPTAERYFGYSEPEVKGQNLSLLIDPAGQQALEEKLLLPAGPEKGECQIETRGRRRDGSLFPIELTAGRLHLHRGLRFIITIHDIGRLKTAEENLRGALEEQEQRVRERTAELHLSNQQLLCEIAERERAEKVLRETQNDLIQASKLAALGQMSAGIVHELNQPLAAIRTFTASSRLLLERNHLDQVKDNFSRITELTERMGKITAQLKLFARKSAGETRPVCLKSALDHALALFEDPIDRRKVQVRLALPADQLLVQGDSLRLEQVLINLIGNALDAMKETVQPQLEVAATKGPEAVRLSICDNGVGISEEHRDQLFDPFFTTKEVGQGLGLGLSITYGIIRDWGGSIRGHNRPDGGAEFVIELPTKEGGAS